MSKHSLYKYVGDQGDFRSSQDDFSRTMYFPLCGPTAKNLKSSITPYLSGDLKIDKDRYVTKPMSTEDLRTPLRNFYVHNGTSVFSVADPHRTDIETVVDAGQLWYQVTKKDQTNKLDVSVLSIIPATGENVELMKVTVTNTGGADQRVSATSAIPIFARALSNKHDHEHVTCLLNRTQQTANGVLVKPTMRFNEEGHTENSDVYYVFGIECSGQSIQGSFPTVDNFCGRSGDLFKPDAVYQNQEPVQLEGDDLQGREVVGALRFDQVDLKPGESRSYIIMTGFASSESEAEATFHKFNSEVEFDKALEANKQYWSQKTDSIVYKTGDSSYNAWMRWVVLQPVLRRIFGCSFLPDHDYGKGGKGWRDIWQDLLSLILIEPEQVKDMLLDNFAGVRIDGSNATIIGASPGEFIGDRNAITRVWMDHGVWPLQTLMLYVHQTGDYDILLKEISYFKDYQLSRTKRKDEAWTPVRGNVLRDMDLNEHRGSVIEHLLIQHLVQFFNVGEHNIIRLEHADWNDGLDMAFDRGESVTFASFYAGNMFYLAKTLEDLASIKKIDEVELTQEILILLDSLRDSIDYDDVGQKTARLFEEYFEAVEPHCSGVKVKVKIADIAQDLRKKGQWIFQHIKANEKVTVGDEVWFNGYYDNQGERVEGDFDGNVRMTLTGQVFPIMSGLADEEEVAQVAQAVRKYLKDAKLGGFRLNSDFKVSPYLDLGRAFGFAYGTKENGAFFSHMIVMYAYALYKRGFAREGYEVLQSIYQMSIDTDKSRIFPGVPEYMDSSGHGMYHYLTGSASWLVLTALTQAFGVVGHRGDLCLEPKLVREEFSANCEASVQCHFASKRFTVQYENPDNLDYGEYRIDSVALNGETVEVCQASDGAVLIPRADLEKAAPESNIKVILKARS